jgi:hypothetical protein
MYRDRYWSEAYMWAPNDGGPRQTSCGQ